MSKNRADAEDLMQETMVGAYRGLKNFAGRSSVKTWLVQIMTRQAAKAWHKSRHSRKTLSLHTESGEQRSSDDPALSTRASSLGVEIPQPLPNLSLVGEQVRDRTEIVELHSVHS